MWKLIFGLLLGVVVGAAVTVPGAMIADHTSRPPSPCKTVKVVGWYKGGPAAVMVYAVDTSGPYEVMDGTPLPVTGPLGTAVVESISFKHEPHVWIYEVDFDYVGPHFAKFYWSDCTSG